MSSNEPLYQIMAFLISMIFCYAPSNWIIRRVLSLVEDPEDIPVPNNHQAWKDALSIPNKESAKWLGFFERLLTLMAFSINGLTILVGWFAFKVATKWDVWQNLIQLPESIDGIDDLEYLGIRRRWASNVYMRFLLGTLVNLLLGGFAYVLMLFFIKMFRLYIVF